MAAPGDQRECNAKGVSSGEAMLDMMALRLHLPANWVVKGCMSYLTVQWCTPGCRWHLCCQRARSDRRKFIAM